MTLIKINKQKLEDLSQFIEALPSYLYTESKELLNGASIGQHFRHIIEFYSTIEKGLDSNIISYDDRERNTNIENDIEYALKKINDLVLFLSKIKEDKKITLKADYSTDSDKSTFIQSTLFRELAYAHDHTVHHLAIIKIALIENKDSINVDPNFGVAPSTIRYKKQLVVNEE